MYFAFDCLSPEFARKTIETLAALLDAHRGKPLNIFVLIDAAFDEEFLIKAFDENSSRISLYEGTPLSGFGKSALFLVQIHAEKVRSTAWMERLVEHSGNRPMWSVIVAAVDINKLAKHLAPFLIAKSDDSLEWPVRWGDVRILPELLKELDHKFVNELLKPIYTWFAPARNGNIFSWSGQGSLAYEAVKYEKLPMDEMTFARLVEVSEPDMVISQIYDRQPEYLRSLQPSECHKRVARQLKIADQFNMRQPAVRQHFSTMALFLRQDFVDLPAIKVLLVNVKNGLNYMSEIRSLENVFWEDAVVNDE